MNTSNFILDEPLPLNQDFKSLKQAGVGYIQEYSGNEWTNLNPADPGVTILDQICFALTELGYCNDFPVIDILTRPNEKLQIKNQFYLPEEILTTSPVTIPDYRKYIIDVIEEIKNVVISPAEEKTSPVNRAYQVYLLIDRFITNEKEINNICKSVFFSLNKRRNINEIFLMPLPLQAATHTINGNIEIDKETDLTKILMQIQNAICDFIFPVVVQTGYQQLIENGVSADEIFSGPLLLNGWIPANSLGEKKNILHTIDIVQLIGSLPGIKSVSIASFHDSKTTSQEIKSKQSQLLTIDVMKSVETGSFEIWCKSKRLTVNSNLNNNSSLRKSGEAANTIVFGAGVNIHADLPKGKFRDINTYYSIQNTFPEIFSVGANALISKKASPFQIAQSRQLKGYLLLFDQVLANQFSQLANIDRLFSFKNSVEEVSPGEIPSFAGKDTFKKAYHAYPVPYMTFAPTYFCQPLYDVPNIKPLLKDNDTFKFSIKIESEKELERKAWNDYKKDPYNPYIKGLMDLIEDDTTSLERRNDILDHLLARHGESPFVINSIIDGSPYTGNSLKDQAIFKSLYLQNLGLLSYFRQKAYNFIGANQISSSITNVPADFEQKIFNYDSTDFIFNSSKIDRIEKLNEHDFINYSALELKLSLLFGLKIQYRNYIADNYDSKENTENTKLAFWMIHQRKGSIFLETNLLLQYAGMENETSELKTIPDFKNRVELILPDFIPQLNTAEFKNRLDLFLQSALPAQVPCKPRFVNSHTLQKIIPAFANWHNCLLYQDQNRFNQVKLKYNAGVLINLITEN